MLAALSNMFGAAPTQLDTLGYMRTYRARAHCLPLLLAGPSPGRYPTLLIVLEAAKVADFDAERLWYSVAFVVNGAL